jgi:hypothetical protein
MLKEKIKSYLKSRINKFFPGVRWPVLLIVVPALLIGIYNLLDILSEVVIEKRRSEAADYENRFTSIQKDLPANASVNYVTDQKSAPDYIHVRYALIPARMVYGLSPRHEYLVVQYLNSAKIPKFEGYTLQKNYENGVMLFQRSR